jgi:hypothetical protein
VDGLVAVLLLSRTALKSRSTLVVVLSVGVATIALVTSCGNATHHLRRALSCRGVTWIVPAGWDGHVYSGSGGLFTMTVANFRLPSEPDAVGEQASGVMKSGSIRLLLLDYGGSQVVNPAFATLARLPLTIDGARIHRFFEHMPEGHRLARKVFHAKEQAFDLQVEFANAEVGARVHREANLALAGLRIRKPSVADQMRTCRPKPVQTASA